MEMNKGHVTQGKTDNLYPEKWTEELLEMAKAGFPGSYEKLLDMIPPKSPDPLDEILRLKRRIRDKSRLRKLDVKMRC